VNNLTDQQKGSLLAFIAVMFITPDSLFIRLSNVDTWGLVFYRGIIPFFTVFFGMLLIYKLNFFKILLTSSYHGLIYVGTFSVTNITFVVSIQNTNVANTLVMIATAPMLSAILGAIFLKEPPDKKTWISIIITFFAIMIAGSLAHGFINHWKNLVPHGLPWPVYIILIPIELMGMFVKPFALTMRLAANMTGGHIAILALLSLIAIFAEIFQSAVAGIGVAAISVPMATAISGLEIIVVLVQAYVFTLLTAVFIGMAINVHH